MAASKTSRSAAIRGLQERSERLFTDLLRDEYPSTKRAAARVSAAQPPGTTSFSWFDPVDAARATELALELAITTGAADSVEDGLSSALDLAERRVGGDPPALVRQALAMFVTHHRPARRLRKPRAVNARPEAFVRSTVGTTSTAKRRAGRAGRGGRARTLGSTLEAQLDYWREDALANEHHEHWHQVYPYSGLFPADWDQWAASADRPGVVALLQALDPLPAGQWATFVQSRPPEEVAEAFLTRANELAQQGTFGEFLAELPAPPYRTLMRLNDRQGELFIYMHRQMLARYDAERLALGLPRVLPFEPPFTATPPDGYDPAPLPNYLPRAPGRRVPSDSASQLTTMQTEVSSAIGTDRFLGPTAAGVRIDRTIIGEGMEAADARLRTPLRLGRYAGLHNFGHGGIARISTPSGPDDRRVAVMNRPAAAIRDPIFWRWHKNIDNVAFSWEQRQPINRLDDLPAVSIRGGLDPGPVTPWTSPDLHLVSRTNSAESRTAAARIAAALADDTVVPVPGRAITRLRGYSFTSELRTEMRQRVLGGRSTTYLTHRPFGYAVRISNAASAPADVTLRVFIAPADVAVDRTTWIELDKVAVTIPATTVQVVYRSDTELSVIKRPAETNPAQAQAGDGDPDDDAYCDCGWPWTLAIPRGNADGMLFRMVAICTDATIDRVPSPSQCGSMSFCGAVDRYPDTRDMGYPFARRLAGSIADTFAALPAAAGRSFTIRHLTR